MSLRTGKTKTDLLAGRAMLTRIDDLVNAGEEFMLETTLATLVYAQRIPRWKASGYRVGLIYLRLPSADHSFERVRRRIAAGGHAIPEAIIRQRFVKSLEYLDRPKLGTSDGQEAGCERGRVCAQARRPNCSQRREEGKIWSIHGARCDRRSILGRQVARQRLASDQNQVAAGS